MRLTLCSLAAAAAVLGATAQSSRAAITCPGQTYVQPFIPWGDSANYVLLPNGSFENTKGWSLSGGAAQVAGNEPFFVNAAGDSHSLALPSGASAVSPSMCFTLLHPDLRFFVRNTGSTSSLLEVDVITNVLGLKLTTPVASLSSGASWQPTAQLPFLTNLLAPVSEGVQFKFTAQGRGGAWQIDDDYVDPFKER